MLLLLGNHNPISELGGKPKQSVPITIPDEDYNPVEFVQMVFEDGGVWCQYATAGARPRWVASDDPAVVEEVRARFPAIQVREIDLPPATVPPPPMSNDAIEQLIRDTVAGLLADQKGTP